MGAYVTIEEVKALPGCEEFDDATVEKHIAFVENYVIGLTKARGYSVPEPDTDDAFEDAILYLTACSLVSSTGGVPGSTTESASMVKLGDLTVLKSESSSEEVQMRPETEMNYCNLGREILEAWFSSKITEESIEYSDGMIGDMDTGEVY